MALLAMGPLHLDARRLSGETLPTAPEILPHLMSNANRELGLEHDSAQVSDMCNHRVVLLGSVTDCSRPAIRQQAASITCVYRHDQQNILGQRHEVQSIKDEDIRFLFNQQPIESNR